MHMKGEHPIDDLFARGLRDASSTPPPAVWERIVLERNWAHVTLLTLRRRWGYMLLGLLLLGGGGLYFATQNGTPAPAGTAPSAAVLSMEATTSAVRVELVVGSPGTLRRTVGQDTPIAKAQNGVPEARAGRVEQEVTRQRSKANTDPHAAASELITLQSKAGGTEPLTVTISTKPAVGQKAHSPGSRPSTAASTHAGTDAAASETIVAVVRTTDHTVEPTSYPIQSSAFEYDATVTAQASSFTGTPRNVAGVTAKALGATTPVPGDARQMRTLPSLTSVTLGTAALPTVAQVEDPYVLRNKRIFVGLQIDWSSVRGEWRGTSEEVGALNRSEAWLNRKGFGLVGGLRWRNGMHVAIAAGIAQQHSRFLRTMTIAGDTSTTVDTTWIATPAGPQTLYTWDIVPVTIAEPGIEEHTAATNTYTQFRLAPELGYGRRFGRWSAGLRAGPVITVTLARKGNTLEPSLLQPENEDLPRNSPSVISLDDRSVDDRFRLSWGAFAGLDINYHLTEGLSLSAGPAWSTNFAGAAEGTPVASLSEFGGTLRLLFTLPERERKAP